MILDMIPYELSANILKLLEKKEMRLAFNFLLALGRPNDDIGMKAVLKCIKGLGDKTLNSIKEYSSSLKQSLYQSIQ